MVYTTINITYVSVCTEGPVIQTNSCLKKNTLGSSYSARPQWLDTESVFFDETIYLYLDLLLWATQFNLVDWLRYTALSAPQRRDWVASTP